MTRPDHFIKSEYGSLENIAWREVRKNGNVFLMDKLYLDCFAWTKTRLPKSSIKDQIFIELWR